MWGWNLPTCTLTLSLDSWDRTVGWTGQPVLWVKEGYGSHHDLAGKEGPAAPGQGCWPGPTRQGREVTLGSFSNPGISMSALVTGSSEGSGEREFGAQYCCPSPLGALSVPEAVEVGFYAYLLGGGLREKFSDLGAPWPDHLSECLGQGCCVKPRDDSTACCPQSWALGAMGPAACSVGSLPGPGWDQRP